MQPTILGMSSYQTFEWRGIPLWRKMNFCNFFQCPITLQSNSSPVQLTPHSNVQLTRQILITRNHNNSSLIFFSRPKISRNMIKDQFLEGTIFTQCFIDPLYLNYFSKCVKRKFERINSRFDSINETL